jgi:hypothetical protein
MTLIIMPLGNVLSKIQRVKNVFEESEMPKDAKKTDKTKSGFGRTSTVWNNSNGEKLWERKNVKKSSYVSLSAKTSSRSSPQQEIAASYIAAGDDRDGIFDLGEEMLVQYDLRNLWGMTEDTGVWNSSVEDIWLSSATLASPGPKMMTTSVSEALEEELDVTRIILGNIDIFEERFPQLIKKIQAWIQVIMHGLSNLFLYLLRTAYVLDRIGLRSCDCLYCTHSYSCGIEQATGIVPAHSQASLWPCSDGSGCQGGG